MNVRVAPANQADRASSVPPLLLGLMLCGSPLMALIFTVLGPVLPAVAGHFGGERLTAQMIMTMPSLGIMVGGPIGGWLVERHGVRRVILWMLVAYALSGCAGFVLDDRWTHDGLAICAGRGLGRRDRLHHEPDRRALCSRGPRTDPRLPGRDRRGGRLWWRDGRRRARGGQRMAGAVPVVRRCHRGDGGCAGHGAHRVARTRNGRLRWRRAAPAPAGRRSSCSSSSMARHSRTTSRYPSSSRKEGSRVPTSSPGSCHRRRSRRPSVRRATAGCAEPSASGACSSRFRC